MVFSLAHLDSNAWKTREAKKRSGFSTRRTHKPWSHAAAEPAAWWTARNTGPIKKRNRVLAIPRGLRDFVNINSRRQNKLLSLVTNLFEQPYNAASCKQYGYGRIMKNMPVQHGFLRANLRASQVNFWGWFKSFSTFFFCTASSQVLCSWLLWYLW